ncbi:MAG: four helix bundle protein [Chitinophagaceae bacterium]|nr:four helix bundle protein [Chitinophagaceae bacterium]MCW5926782.1 four helix bundle protein [Chitinophagaceae bacterium]
MKRQSNEAFNTEMRNRTKRFAISVIQFYRQMQKTEITYILGKQLLRAATSVAANFRAACRGRSGAEFYSKICIVTEEADETQFWLELFEESSMVKEEAIQPLYKEATEILAIVTSIKHKLRPKEM